VDGSVTYGAGGGWLFTDSMPDIVGEMSGTFLISAPAGKPAGFQARRLAPRGTYLGTNKAMITSGGGAVATGILSRPRTSTLLYDHSQAPGARWTVGPSTQISHTWGGVYLISGGPLTGKVVLFSGLDEFWRTTIVCEVYDPVANTWRRTANMPTPGNSANGGRASGFINGFGDWRNAMLSSGEIIDCGGQTGQTFRSAESAAGGAGSDAVLFLPEGIPTTYGAIPAWPNNAANNALNAALVTFVNTYMGVSGGPF